MNPAPKQADLTTFSGRFAHRLRTLREKTGMTGQEFAEALKKAGYKTTGTTYYRWESGQSEPPFDALPSLATALKLKSVRELFPKD